jgi:RNA polymerase sigma-70 factor (sigma-E family)
MDQAAVHALDFATYVAERRESLLRAARAISGDPDLAEDLLHTALARVLPHWSTLRDQGAADAYVRRAMVNQHLTWCRQRSRRPERVTDQVPEPRGGGFETSVRDELGLWPMVTALPRRQRSAVVLRYYEGLSVQETSQVLRCSTGTVKSTTHRGLATLRRRAVEAGLAPAG